MAPSSIALRRAQFNDLAFNSPHKEMIKIEGIAIQARCMSPLRTKVGLGPRRGRTESPSQLRAMERFGIRRRETFRTEQTFRDYAEFLAKLSTQSPVAIARTGIRRGRANRKLRFSRVRRFRFVLTTARVRSSLGYHT